MKYKFLLLTSILSFIAPLAFSVPLDDLVSAAHAAQLRSSGELIIETQLKNPSPKLLPKNSELNQFVSVIIKSLKPGMLVETLYLYKKPDKYRTSSDIWDITQKTGISNQTMALSSLTGTQYFSVSRNEMRTFYEYSSVIDGEKTKKPLPDPFFTHPPDTLTLFAQQKDLTFGDNIYRYTYVISNNAVFFAQENMTSMNIGIFPAIGKNNLRSVMSVFDCGDSILIYAVSMAKAASVPGMADRISSSFSSRAEAILKWFAGRLDKEIFIN
ncbi:MAG: hypothetical protein FWC22_05475 [Treponema sp.]|nr:hypothetical protein [Treponema sp.]